jgi:hypothetical protein
MQWLCKRHVTAATLTYAKIKLSEAVFSVPSVSRLYNEVTLASRKWGRKGNPVNGGIPGHPSSGGGVINRETWSSRLGRLESEIVKYGSTGFKHEDDYAGEGQQ